MTSWHYIYLCSPLHPYCLLSTMSPTRWGKPAIRRAAPGSASPGPEPALPPAPALTPTSNNNLFQEFMQTCIEKVRNQASAALAAPAASATEARDDTDRLLKPRNPNLYYGHLYMECYYFCQQWEEYFEIMRSLGHKRVPFATSFLKDYILNQWQ